MSLLLTLLFRTEPEPDCLLLLLVVLCADCADRDFGFEPVPVVSEPVGIVEVVGVEDTSAPCAGCGGIGVGIDGPMLLEEEEDKEGGGKSESRVDPTMTVTECEIQVDKQRAQKK